MNKEHRHSIYTPSVFRRLHPDVQAALLVYSFYEGEYGRFYLPKGRLCNIWAQKHGYWVDHDKKIITNGDGLVFREWRDIWKVKHIRAFILAWLEGRHE